MHCFKIVVILKARENRVHMYKKKEKKNPILIIQRPDLQVSKVSRVGQIFKLWLTAVKCMWSWAMTQDSKIILGVEEKEWAIQ